VELWETYTPATPNDAIEDAPLPPPPAPVLLAVGVLPLGDLLADAEGARRTRASPQHLSHSQTRQFG
jgi:hypothetical protein